MLVDQNVHPLNTPTPTPTRARGGRRSHVHARYDAAQDTVENRKHWAWADNYSASAPTRLARLYNAWAIALSVHSSKANGVNGPELLD